MKDQTFTYVIAFAYDSVYQLNLEYIHIVPHSISQI